MNVSIRGVSSLACVVIMLTAFTSTAVAQQARGRVIKDNSIVWNTSFTTIAAVVKAGTIVDIVSRRGNWYEVALPKTQTAGPVVGLISVSQVELLEGSPTPPVRAEATGEKAARQPPVPRPVSFWGFGDVGFTAFAAHQSFDAVLDQCCGFFYGAGAEVHFGFGLYVGGMIERFNKTGQRAFVNNGAVYRLGIPDEITIVPVSATAGYRFNRRTYIPYIGGAVGSYSYKESSGFSDAGENVDARFTSYSVVAGVEFPVESWSAGAIEFRFTSVPNAIGVSGVSAAFGEHNLGGFDVRLKLLFGK